MDKLAIKNAIDQSINESLKSGSVCSLLSFDASDTNADDLNQQLDQMQQLGYYIDVDHCDSSRISVYINWAMCQPSH